MFDKKKAAIIISNIINRLGIKYYKISIDEFVNECLLESWFDECGELSETMKYHYSNFFKNLGVLEHLFLSFSFESINEAGNYEHLPINMLYSLIEYEINKMES